MLVSPLLSLELVKHVLLLAKRGDARDEILDVLSALVLEERIQILRFLDNHCEGKYSSALYEVWQSYISYDHVLNTKEHRRALHEIGQWWDAFGGAEDLTIQQYDELEALLDTLGNTPEGIEYFKWVALNAVGLYPRRREEQPPIWDEHRRGAIICLAKYAYSKEMELFLARHLDDWHTIQVEVIAILAALKSRLLPKLASWYIKDDSLLKPHLEEYGFEEITDEDNEKEHNFVS